ncbi:glutaredoxin domain protein [Stachybotrys elegans]|uniref:Glutaredoxin domain protein n=1 Tax=Stachybotrys elegans TaxID=80388 RepID=A0A8K0WX67_9HYPO|nr:glutaredoxin domain protein [Stachybotrys elegans]
MPSPRQLRLVMTASLIAVVVILFYTSSIQKERDMRTIPDFYHKTVNAMNAGADGGGSPRGQPVLNSETGGKVGHIPADKDADGDLDADDIQMAHQMQERLKAAEQQAKEQANEKGGLRPDPPSNVIGVGSSAGGQGKKGKGGANEPKDAAEESEEQHQAEMELNSILKKSPVIIFSKTYCPYSKRAKGLLLEKYHITPDPYVVELDEHALGPLLQDQLNEKTGRRTVPNIMINGVSIGGADDIVALDNDDKLVDKIVNLGNKRVEMVSRFVSGNV